MKSRIHSKTFVLQEPVTLIDHIPSRESMAWIKEGQGMVGGGVAIEVPINVGAQRFEFASQDLKAIFGEADIEDPLDIPGSGPIAFGSFTFDPDTPGSRLVIPDWTLGSSDQGTWLTINSTSHVNDLAPKLPSTQAYAPVGEGLLEDTSSLGWDDDVLKARDLIRAGHLEKVVLARAVDVRTRDPIDVRSVAKHLEVRFPGCFTFVFADLVGASPELLVRKLGWWVDSIPLAGSAARHPDPRQDDILGAQLLKSRKNRWEHELAVRTVVDVLRPLCDQFQVEDTPFLYLLPNLQHLGTKIQGHLSRDIDPLELAGQLHPTAAVCGLPRDRAMDVIRSLEHFDRGRYSGPVGWVDGRGDGEWAIALRCAQVSGAGATVYAGAGIVADSDPDSEIEETRLKLGAVLSAFGLG